MRRLVPLLALICCASVAGPLPAQEPRPAGSAAPVTLDYAFFKSQVLPIFAKQREGHTRCVACHGGDQGAGRLRVERPGQDGNWTEEQARQAFASVSRMVVPGDPGESRLLLHPLRFEAGGDKFHFGGKHFVSTNDPEWQTFYSWVMGTKVGR